MIPRRFNVMTRTYLLAVKQNAPVDNHPPGLVYAMREACPKYDDVYPPFDFCHHQTPHRSQAFAALILQLLLPALRDGILCRPHSVRNGRRGRRRGWRAHVWKGFWEVPPLEDLLVNEVPVVPAHEGLCSPPPPVEGFSVLHAVGNLFEGAV